MEPFLKLLERDEARLAAAQTPKLQTADSRAYVHLVKIYLSSRSARLLFILTVLLNAMDKPERFPSSK